MSEVPLYGYIVYDRNPLGLVDPSFRALSGRLKLTVRRHEFNTDSLPAPGCACQQTRTTSSGVVFIMNTIPPYGIGAVCIIFGEKAPIPYGKSYS